MYFIRLVVSRPLNISIHVHTCDVTQVFLFVFGCVCIRVFVCLTDPPNVTSLTVDGHEVNGDYFIQEGQEVTVTCLFDKGNPPVPVSLLDKHGRHLSSSKVSGQVSNSFVARCEDEWPVVLCKSEGPEHKRSVSFIAICKSLFSECYP